MSREQGDPEAARFRAVGSGFPQVQRMVRLGAAGILPALCGSVRRSRHPGPSLYVRALKTMLRIGGRLPTA